MSKAEELLDKALDFIVETQEQNDYICEKMCEEYVGDYCEKNCQNLNKECVRLFLQKVYTKDKVMKANEAPEKLYIDLFKGEFNVSYSPTNNSVEYTRTDAFIEKAAKWLEDNAIEYWGTEAVDNGMMIVEFKKAMRL